MRQLTAKQKKLLDKEFIEYAPNSVDELNEGVFERLEEINDTEILWQEVNRYLSDKTMEALHG